MISSSAGTARTLRGLVPGRLFLIIVIIASSECEVMGCHDEERRALLEIKTSINSPGNGLALPNWGSTTTKAGEDCCQWDRIICDPNTGRVVEIDLLGERLTAMVKMKIPWYPNLDMLSEFQQLERLNLGLNVIIGPIPGG